MAQRAYELEDPFLYERYLRALRQHGEPQEETPSPGHVIRLCHNCGLRSIFRLDPNGNWHECLHCGHFA
jgi:hypothetical protein